jgi:hypothetical protein
MKNLSLGIVQRISEYEYLIKRIPLKKKNFYMIPLNLETLIYYKKNNINYIDLTDYLDNKIHKEALKTFQKIVPQINKEFLKNNLMKTRYKGIIRKYYNSIFFINKTINQIEKKFIINDIYVSGWDSYNFNDMKKNFFVSRIVYELYKDKLNIKLVSKLQNKFFSKKLKLILPKKIDYDYIYVNNLGYNFKKIVLGNFIFDRFKILTPDDKNLGLIKKFIYNFLLVRFIKIKQEKSKKSSMNLSIINFKIKNKKIVKLLNFRHQHVRDELENLIDQKKQYMQLFDIKKPSKIFLNNSRGINKYLIEFSNKEKILCFLISHGTLSYQKNYYGKLYNDTIAEEVVEKTAYNCAQTELAYSYLKNITKKKNILRTGNLIFSSGISKGKENFLYAVTSRDFINTQYFGIETFYEFFDNLKFLNNYSKKNNLKIIVKLHPGVMYLNKELPHFFANLYFSTDDIQKLLKNLKAVISFSSTVIEDALNLKVPVILLDRWKRYNHFSQINFIKRTKIKNYINNEKELDNIVKNFDIFKKKFLFKKVISEKNSFDNFKKLLKM